MFFEKNIPEAFRARIEMQAERENKRVEVLGKFLDLITNSNMIGKGKLIVRFVHIHAFR